jgi:hypothetical protein
MREKQKQRISRAKSIDIQTLEEIKEGVYRTEVVNDKGENRVLMLTPSKVMSSSKDMLYNNYSYVGKYLISCCIESEEFSRELYSGITEDIIRIEEKIKLVEEREDLVEALDLVSDIEISEKIHNRLDEIAKDIPEEVDNSKLQKSKKNLEIVRKFIYKQHFAQNDSISQENEDIPVTVV